MNTLIFKLAVELLLQLIGVDVPELCPEWDIALEITRELVERKFNQLLISLESIWDNILDAF